jgi:hypothetical protein
MRARLVAVAIVVLAAGCGGHHGAPNVKGKAFPDALSRLRAHGYLVAVPSFPPIDGTLESYRVVSQRTSGRRTVTLKVTSATTREVVLMAIGSNPPPVPSFVGQTYRNAYRFALLNGAVLRVTRVKPLQPSLSADGIDSFVVVSQRLDGPHAVTVTLGERPCWKAVIQDWYVDGTLNGNYERRCYREALDALPDDGPRPEIERLLRRRLR